VNYGLQIVTPAATYPATVDEVATYLRADAAGEAAHLTALLQHAVDEVERYTGRALLSATYRLVLADWPRGGTEFATYPRYPRGPYIRTIELPRTPATAITSVSYYPANSETLTVLPSSQYIAVTSYEPGMVYLKEGYEWPELSERPDAVQVTFTAGYTLQDIPKSVKQAILLLCRFYYAGGSPNDVDQGGSDIDKAHLLLNKLRISGWSA